MTDTCRTGALLALLAVTCGAHAAGMPDFPAQIDKSARYVIYSHGRIAEGADERPVSPEHGVFDFPAIRDALVKSGDVTLIARHRPKDADAKAEAERLEQGVRRLAAAGVKPSHITLVGFSKGAYITALASSHLKDLRINTAILAICVNGVPSNEPMTLAGNVLSIYETSDDVGSCRKLGQDSEPGIRFEEVSLSTGLKHGTFYRPIEAWLTPLLAWISRTNR